MKTFCVTCRNLDPSCTLPLKNDDQISPTGYSVNSRLVHEFKVSSAAGCNFCHFIHKALLFFDDKLNVSAAKAALRIFTDGAVDVSNYNYTIQLYTPFGYPAAWGCISVIPELSATPFSDSALGFIRNCIRNCTTHHKECSLTSTFVPTRLLDIEDADRGSIKLVESVSNTTRYIALSYCWGTVGNLKMTRNSMLAMKTEILVSDLPGTIRDAVRVASALKCQYLWVDALCIIQDSKEDWEFESSRMASVYSNAWLTLAASSAASATAGFLQNFKPERTQDTFSVEWTNNHGSKTILRARQIPVHYFQDTGYPLDKRAWTFQELVLSTRAVLFGPDEIRWTCKSGKNCECQAWGNHEALQISAHGLKSPEEAYGFWKSMVQRYTSRSLTYVTDTLPAIAGLAQVIQSVTNSEYVAGLWMGSLVSNLTWYAGSGGGALMNRRTNSEYIAPTFSWASVEGKVVFIHSSDEIEMDLFEECQVVKVNATPVGKSPLGQVSDARIQIRGFLFPTVPTCAKDSKIPRVKLIHGSSVSDQNFNIDFALGQHGFTNEKGDSETSACRLRRGSDGLKPPFDIPASLFYIGYTKCKGEEEIRQLLLVLGKSPRNPHAYERLGLLDLPYTMWEDRWIQFPQSALTTIEIK